MKKKLENKLRKVAAFALCALFGVVCILFYGGLIAWFIFGLAD